MATLRLSAYPAKANERGGGFSVIFSLNGDNPPIEKDVEVKNLADVKDAQAVFVAEIEATGRFYAISLSIKNGRSPVGFNAWRKEQGHYLPVNRPSVA